MLKSSFCYFLSDIEVSHLSCKQQQPTLPHSWSEVVQAQCKQGEQVKEWQERQQGRVVVENKDGGGQIKEEESSLEL